MKTTFKKFMGVERPIEPKPLPPPKEPHPVPKGYKRVKDGSFNKLVKVDEASKPMDAVYQILLKNLLGLVGQQLTTKIIVTAILKDYKLFVGEKYLNSHITRAIELSRKLGFDTPEFKMIEKSLRDPKKVDEAIGNKYSTHMLQGYEQGYYSKGDILKPLLKDLKDRGGDDFMGGIQGLIDKFRKAGYNWT